MLDQGFMEAQESALERFRVSPEDLWIDAPVVGGQAHVLAVGEGTPVVLLNGIGTPAAAWAPLMSHLSGYRLYAVDLPGFGMTDTTPQFAEDLRSNAVRFLLEVLDGLDLEQAVIVSNSLGSLWASWLAIEHPGRVGGLVYIGCPAVVLDTSAPLPMRLLSVRLLGRLMMRIQQPSERQVEGLAKMVREHPLPPEIAALILATERLDHFEHMFLTTLHQLLRLRGNRPELALTAEQLAEIRAPALLVFSANDPMGSKRVGENVFEAMDDAELHVVEGGHAPWFRHADQIAPLVDSFVQRVAPLGG